MSADRMRREAAAVEGIGWAALAILSFDVLSRTLLAAETATGGPGAAESVGILIAAGVASAGRVLRALVRARALEPRS